MFKHSARRFLSFSLRRAQQQSSLTSQNQQATVTLVLDDKPVTVRHKLKSVPHKILIKTYKITIIKIIAWF